jgi:viologen exporter family transport system ATP-binding protein
MELGTWYMERGTFMKDIIRVDRLCKYFQVNVPARGRMASVRNLFSRKTRLVKAVDGVSFRIQPGELVGYLGPNGAGKSTTLKMLSGLLVPSSGELQVNGMLPWRQRGEYVAHIGAVFGQRTTLWWDLPVIESLELLGYLYKVPEHRFRHNLNQFRNMLELNEFLHTPVRALSLGQRMRADLCAALLHEPKVVFLDEPTIGLDVVAKERIRQFILHTNQQQGTTVILTTHDIRDVERLCERVLIIDHGRLLYDGGLENLRERFGGKRQLLVEFEQEYSQVRVEGAQVTSLSANRATLEFERGSIAASELINRLSQRYRIRDLEVREPDLEATIRRIYEERLLENEE